MLTTLNSFSCPNSNSQLKDYKVSPYSKVKEENKKEKLFISFTPFDDYNYLLTFE